MKTRMSCFATAPQSSLSPKLGQGGGDIAFYQPEELSQPSCCQPRRSPNISGSQTEEAYEMPFSSLPVLYPASSSPPAVTKKRKLFRTFKPIQETKKPRLIGGFVEDDDDDYDEEDNLEANGGQVEPTPPLSPLNTADEDSEFTGPRNEVRPTPPTSRSPSLQPPAKPMLRKLPAKTLHLETCSGQAMKIPMRMKAGILSYEQTVAQRSVTAAGRAKKAYYGIDIHQLIDEAKIQTQLQDAEAEARRQQEIVNSVERPPSRNLENGSRTVLHQMWTEKYRAKKFTELVGDERTHRSVLRWLKGWDEVVFPGNAKPKSKRINDGREAENEKQHRKILLLTGPPGLGKTTLAHVCAKQAGYEVLEINASDDRSRDVVKGRIKDALGTETVRGIKEQGKARRAGRPVCVVVDEVDGVTTGSGGNGGEGGFTKALIDLVQIDQKNTAQNDNKEGFTKNTKKKGDNFRMLRPLILICNDVYAPSLRPLRNSSFAEIVHVRNPPIEKVIARLKNVFEKECIPCDNDAIRRLCESSWGLGTRKQNSLGSQGAGEGDIRGVLVQGEWLAHKLRAMSTSQTASRLTRKWIESNLGQSQSAAGQKGLGRGGIREVVERVFKEGAGMPNLPASLTAEESRLVAESKGNPIGVADLRKRAAITALREMIDTCGDHDRLMTDCFATWPSQNFQDDVNMSKPNASYEWLHFHDSLSSRIFAGQEWELTPYLSSSACGFHHLFATVNSSNHAWNEGRKDEEEANIHPFTGPRADFAAYEAQKQNKTTLTELQSSFSAPLLRLYSSIDAISMELVPNVSKMLAPEVKPVVVGGSGGSASVASVRKENEKSCIRYAVRVMDALNVCFEKIRIETEGGGVHSAGGFAYRMEP